MSIVYDDINRLDFRVFDLDLREQIKGEIDIDRIIKSSCLQLHGHGIILQILHQFTHLFLPDLIVSGIYLPALSVHSVSILSLASSLVLLSLF